MLLLRRGTSSSCHAGTLLAVVAPLQLVLVPCIVLAQLFGGQYNEWDQPEGKKGEGEESLGSVFSLCPRNCSQIGCGEKCWPSMWEGIVGVGVTEIWWEGRGLSACPKRGDSGAELAATGETTASYSVTETQSLHCLLHSGPDSHRDLKLNFAKPKTWIGYHVPCIFYVRLM